MPTSSADEAAERARHVEALAKDPWLAHRFFFPHRMAADAAGFHPDIAADFWFGARRKQIMGFRGCAKSTLGESNLALAGCYRAFNNIVVIGASEARAAERLAVVAYQLAMNEALLAFFGQQKGAVWTQTKLVLAWGGCIQALGRDQDIRGLKHMDWRPDYVFVDDFEDKESVQTPSARDKTFDWFLGELMLACDPAARVLVNGTPLDEESVPMRLQREAEWPTRTIPVEYLDDKGERQAAWPGRFPLSWIDAERRTYIRAGRLRLWDAEMMCDAKSAGSAIFTRDMFRHVARERSWHAVYAFIDPARTTNRSSATTGWAVWSWIGAKLIVWAAGAESLKPDAIVDLVFAIAENWNPVWIGVEEDGLNEWLLQPIRAAMLRRHVLVPYRAMRAPRGKLDFIRGLQPFYDAGEVEHASPLPELEEQLMAFPTGRIDAPNALAYALPMRPGALIYDNFGSDHIARDLEVIPSRPLYLAANATRTTVAAGLVQYVDGQIRILADWVIEGAAADAVLDLHAEAALEGDSGREVANRPLRRDWTEALKLPDRRREFARLPIRWVVPPHHREQWNNVGLMQAIARIPAKATCGLAADTGKVVIAEALNTRSGGAGAILVSDRAVWTLRAFAGGYSRAIVRSGPGGGHLGDHPQDGPYRVLMGGLESWAGMMTRIEDSEDDTGEGYAFDKHGRRYRSAMPAR